MGSLNIFVENTEGVLCSGKFGISLNILPEVFIDPNIFPTFRNKFKT
jgi:hypothetical protein